MSARWGVIAGHTTRPMDFWLGFFLMLFAGQFLSNLVPISEPRTWQVRVLAGVLVLTGATLFTAGAAIFARGVNDASSQCAAAVAAVAFAISDLLPQLIYGNPFALVVGPVGGLIAALGLIGGTVLFAVSVWLAYTAFSPTARGRGRSFGEVALLVLGAAAFERGLVPLLRLLISVGADPGALVAWMAFSPLALSERLLPVVVRGLAGLAGIWAVRLAAGRSAGTLTGLAGLAIVLWAASDLLYVAALWSAWTSGLSPAVPTALKIRTGALLVVPALALLALGETVRREGSRPEPARAVAETGRR